MYLIATNATSGECDMIIAVPIWLFLTPPCGIMLILNSIFHLNIAQHIALAEIILIFIFAIYYAVIASPILLWGVLKATSAKQRKRNMVLVGIASVVALGIHISLFAYVMANIDQP